MGWTYAFPNLCEPEGFAGYTLLVLCIEEVGVDLELCVHAHEPDVELIMAASRKI